MKSKEYMRVNHITDLSQFCRDNLHLGQGPVAVYICPKCDDMLNNSSDIETHVCTPSEEEVITDGIQGAIPATIPVKLVAEKDGFAIYCGNFSLKSTTVHLPSDVIDPIVRFAEEVYKQGFADASRLLMNQRPEGTKK